MSKPSSAKNPGPLIVSFGEMLIDFVPDVAGVSLAESSAFIKAPGGAPANVACAIAKLGGNSSFIGKVGEDEFGHMLVNMLKKNGVNSDGVIFDKQARTALAFVTLKTDGQREFMFYRNPSADMLLKDAEINMGLIKQAKIFHYGSISLISEPCKSAHMAAMKAAKQAGVLLSYDPNVRLPLWPSPEAARNGIKSIWNQADFIKVSDDEVAFLTQGNPEKEDVVMSLWHDNFKLLVVTDADKGCRYFTKSFKGKVSGFQVKTIDTTGAGDAFVGAFLHSVANDTNIFNDEKKLKEALMLANACGAISTTIKGAIPSLPDMSQAQKLKSSAKSRNDMCSKWHTPPIGVFKRNVDASLLSDSSMGGIGMIIRDDKGDFIACRQLPYTASLSVKEAEALGLYQAISWARSLHLERVAFENDAQSVVNAILSSYSDETEFGSLVEECKQLLLLEQNYSVRYVKRQANEIAHMLAREARFYVSPITFYETPNSIVSFMHNLCTEVNH